MNAELALPPRLRPIPHPERGERATGEESPWLLDSDEERREQHQRYAHAGELQAEKRFLGARHDRSVHAAIVAQRRRAQWDVGHAAGPAGSAVGMYP